jgi:hypothetical protein
MQFQSRGGRNADPGDAVKKESSAANTARPTRDPLDLPIKVIARRIDYAASGSFIEMILRDHVPPGLRAGRFWVHKHKKDEEQTNNQANSCKSLVLE